jgi:excisionase family DNA binding protein
LKACSVPAEFLYRLCPDNEVYMEQRIVVTDATQLPEKLTVTQVASWLQLSSTVIYSLVSAEKIPFARICRSGSRGGRGILRFDKYELMQWWERQREGPRVDIQTLKKKKPIGKNS